MYLLNYNKTYFLKSFSKLLEININTGIEIAFVGYSNSGKSSVINCLTNKKNLARSSKTPGRTQLINFFEVVSGFRIVDLPGYGYSSAPIAVKFQWQTMLYKYLENRNCLKGLVLCMDIRRPLKILDQSIINLALEKKISLYILLTKCDQMKIGQQKIQLRIVENKLLSKMNIIEVELFSSLKKIGILKLKNQLNTLYKKYLFN